MIANAYFDRKLYVMYSILKQTKHKSFCHKQTVINYYRVRAESVADSGIVVSFPPPVAQCRRDAERSLFPVLGAAWLRSHSSVQSPWSEWILPTMNPVEEDVVPADAEVVKDSVKPAPDPDKIILRKNRDKESKKEQRR